MNKDDPIFVAGHQGLIGSAVVRRLKFYGYHNLILKERNELELRDVAETLNFFKKEQPAFVVMAAGRVAGIVENNKFPADFLDVNLSIQQNIFKAAYQNGVRRTIFLGSSCMYPKQCLQPMSETSLLTGAPEETSLSYAIAKLAGLQMCLALNKQHGEKRFIPVIPNSAYGPNDNFNPNSGHVLSALINRFHEAVTLKKNEVTLWGSGVPRREFVYADDIADAIFLLLQADHAQLELPLNIGNGQDYSISELAVLIANVTGYSGQINWDTSKPNGAMQKLLDSSRMQQLGWRPKVSFEEGIKKTYEWYVENKVNQDQVK